MTIHFQTRDHIIGWLERHCPRKAIVRAIRQGTTELLGGFTLIPPGTRSGWIIRVTSIHERVWLVAVTPNKKQTDYEIRILKEIPWSRWYGDGAANLLYRGDKPWLYRLIKERS